MSCRGWPHVSFYPAEGGGSFGGNYFGTGDSVLKQWWGSKEADRKTTGVPTGSNGRAWRSRPGKPDTQRPPNSRTRSHSSRERPVLEWRQDHHPRSPRHRRHASRRGILLDQGNVHAGLARPGHAGCLHHRDGRRKRDRPDTQVQIDRCRSRATARSRSYCRCHAGAGRMSVFTRPTGAEISAATILERAILF